MKRCPRCKWRYPDDLLSPYISSAGNTVCCGICALELSNEVHGIKRKKFDGPMAEAFRQRAITWRDRRKHTYDNPAFERKQ